MRDDPPRVPPGAEISILASGDTNTDALLSGYKWSSGALTYSFYSSAVFAGSYYGSEANVTEVSEAVKQNYRQIFAWAAQVMNLQFTEVTETRVTYGQIRILCSTTPEYAYSYYPSAANGALAGDIVLNTAYDRLGDQNGFQHPPGKHGYMSLVHELGHALGLKHPFDSTPNLPTDLDNSAHTIMSYTFVGSTTATYMPLDMKALHYLYGVRAYNTDDTIYLFGSRVDQFSVGGQLFWNTPYVVRQILMDSAGGDTLDLTSAAYESGGYTVDLRGGGWILPNRANHTTYFDSGCAVCFTSVLETVINSGSSDTIVANAATNRFGGYRPDRTTGNDIIRGASMADTVDLSGYEAGQVTESAVGSDLRLTLLDKGTVTIEGYYTGATPRIVYKSIAPGMESAAAYDLYATAEDTLLTVAAPGVLANDTDPTGGGLLAIRSSDPSHGTVSFYADGSFAYRPFTNYYGGDTFGYYVRGSLGDSLSTLVCLTVTPRNDAPVASNQTVSTGQNLPAAVTLRASDIEDSTLTYSIAGAPAHGVLTGVPPVLIYVPESGYQGSDAFTFAATDPDGASGTGTVSVTVGPPFTLRINFQPSSVSVPEGFFRDTGSIFGDRANGYMYGWKLDNSGATRQRNSPLSPDVTYDTLCFMNNPNTSREPWEIAVPVAGSYTVRTVAGDPLTTSPTTYHIMAEGTNELLLGTVTAGWVDRTSTVYVADGRLTLTTGSSATFRRNTICFIEIAGNQNAAPVVVAGQAAVVSNRTFALNGAVADDGLPEGATLTSLWTRVSGPGTATFADAMAPTTTVDFSADGSYVLRLMAGDGDRTAAADLTLDTRVATVPGGAPGAPRVTALRMDPALWAVDFECATGTSCQVESATNLPAGDAWLLTPYAVSPTSSLQVAPLALPGSTGTVYLLPTSPARFFRLLVAP